MYIKIKDFKLEEYNAAAFRDFLVIEDEFKEICVPKAKMTLVREKKTDINGSSIELTTRSLVIISDVSSFSFDLLKEAQIFMFDFIITNI